MNGRSGNTPRAPRPRYAKPSSTNRRDPCITSASRPHPTQDDLLAPRWGGRGFIPRRSYQPWVSARGGKEPQGLRPLVFAGAFGTTKVVPFRLWGLVGSE